ncbi:MAG: hypothetical protein I8H75_03880 [Myxococcaceae bacterium]|nr:hypothetical protein [Myxococcaceae bacterium]MBH2006467.1 hypothetical protein [Myxococcaceae bacterium]
MNSEIKIGPRSNPFDLDQRNVSKPRIKSIEWEDVAPKVGGSLSWSGKAKQAIGQQWAKILRFFRNTFGTSKIPTETKKPAAMLRQESQAWTNVEWAPKSKVDVLPSQAGPVDSLAAHESWKIVHDVALQRAQEESAEAPQKAIPRSVTISDPSPLSNPSPSSPGLTFKPWDGQDD